MKTLRLVLFDGPAVRARADALLAAIPEDERPLRGEAGHLDWRMGGEISRLLVSGYVTGRRDEAILIPGGAMLGADRVILIGVGRGVGLAGHSLQRAFRIVAGKLLGLRLESCALAMPAAIEPALDADHLVWGLVSGMANAADGARLEVILPHGHQCGRAIDRAISSQVDDARSRGVDLSVDQLDQLDAEAAEVSASARA